MADNYDREYALLGGAWEEEDVSDLQRGSYRIEDLERYHFFSGSQITGSITISQKARDEGQKLCAQANVRLVRMLSGYDEDNREVLGQAEVIGKSGKEEFWIRLIFSRSEIKNMDCRCPQCRRNYYYSWYAKKTNCPYTAGALRLLEEFLKTHNLGDATDSEAKRLLEAYQDRRLNRLGASAASGEQLRLLPRLIKKGGELLVSFRIGEKRLFVIKKLDVFCKNVKTNATDLYGTNTQLNHNPDNFTKQGRDWIRFINRIVQEEERYRQRLLESGRYYGRQPGIGSVLGLYGWRLDEFYAQMSSEAVDFEDKDAIEKTKGVVTAARENPKVTMRILGQDSLGDGQFHGITVDGRLPELYFGTDTAYYMQNNQLNRVEQDFLKKIEPLASLAKDGKFSFHIGRNHLSEFYYRILPQLEEIADVEEMEPEKFRSYLLPEAHFLFYLDAEEDNVTCRVYVRYGEKEYAVLDALDRSKMSRAEPFRDRVREEETLDCARQLLPEIDWDKGELHCGGDESLVYQMMESGADRLMEWGEVRCTKRFLGSHHVKQARVSVGVSVSAGLLELTVATEDIPKEELLEALASYRAKKKYYRMKNGSFLGLQDPSLEMLAEVMEAAHIKPKEFLKEKMHLPVYRTLYLDKMLEEHDSVYSKRDNRFREIVKGFKTVQDADFEEPQSLSRIMRNYQKNGYKWMRTLESWQFGGILADDMGLGKTLQAIAVLLAAKQEGRQGTSLVVAPAALVFNWGEEFLRFAPSLAVSLIAGSQEERQAKLKDWDNQDVLVTSYDLLKRDIHFYEDKTFLYEMLDEAQYIKNHTTAAAKSVKAISSQIRFALTGTPIENRLSELWSIFDFLMPGFLYGYDVFKREMETPIVKNNDEAAMKRLQKMVGPFILRRLKQDVLKDLPPKLEECSYVQFGSAQQKLYDAQALHMREMLTHQDEADYSKQKIQILAELTRLRQICCDPSLCFENYGGGAAKAEAFLQLVQSAVDGGHRMLVFSQFASMLEILKKMLDAQGIACFKITGDVSKEKRLQMVKEFNAGDAPVFLISLKAGGVGLNLTGADVVIHYDPWWNLATQNQATDRAHRIGQSKKVTVYKLIAKHTIEEKIQKLQEAKKGLAEQALGGQSGQLADISKDELLELLGV